MAVPGIRLLSYNEAERNNYHYVIAEIDAAKFGMSRDELKSVLHSHNILARRYFFPGCHRMEPYVTLYPEAGRYLRVTEAFCERVIALPNGTQISPDQIEKICQLINNIHQTTQI